MMATPGVGAAMTKKAANGDVIDARAVAHNFAWMRPTDLVYSYVVNNWLLGNDPPAFDVLAWNDDATNMSSTFSRDSNALLASGALAEPVAVTLLGTPIDLSRVKSDALSSRVGRPHHDGGPAGMTANFSAVVTPRWWSSTAVTSSRS